MADPTKLQSPGDILTATDPALDARLKRARALAVVGTLMGVEPTVGVASMLNKNAAFEQGSADERNAKRADLERRQQEQAAEQERWDRNFAEQRRQFQQQEARLGSSENNEARKQWSHAVDPITGQMRLYNQITGEWKDGPGGSAPQAAPTAPTVAGFPDMPPGGGKPLTEGQNKNFLGASTMAGQLPAVESLFAGGYRPTQLDKFAVGPSLPGWQAVVQGVVPRSFASADAQEYFNAGSKIVGAILRPESGGAITKDEWDTYGPQWLPWPGDDENTKQRKLVDLRQRMNAMGLQTGSAAGHYSEPPKGAARQGSDAPQGGFKYLGTE